MVSPLATSWCGSIVIAMALSGFFIASRLNNMYPVEAAIVTSCHSGLAGTGMWLSLGLKPRGIDAVCTDCDAYRRGVDGDRRDAIAELDCEACRRAKNLPAVSLAGRQSPEAYSTVRICAVLVLLMVLITSPGNNHQIAGEL